MKLEDGSELQNPPAGVTRIREVITAIGCTCVIVPGDAPLLAFGRSWCLFEIANTPSNPGSLLIRIGWGDWTLERHEGMRSDVQTLSVAEAEASELADQKMILELVVQKFGTVEGASERLRAEIVRCMRAKMACLEA